MKETKVDLIEISKKLHQIELLKHKETVIEYAADMVYHVTVTDNSPRQKEYPIDIYTYTKNEYGEGKVINFLREFNYYWHYESHPTKLSKYLNGEVAADISNAVFAHLFENYNKQLVELFDGESDRDFLLDDWYEFVIDNISSLSSGDTESDLMEWIEEYGLIGLYELGEKRSTSNCK